VLESEVNTMREEVQSARTLLGAEKTEPKNRRQNRTSQKKSPNPIHPSGKPEPLFFLAE